MADDIFGGYYEEEDKGKTTTDTDIFGGYFDSTPTPSATPVSTPVQQAIDTLPEPTSVQAPKEKLGFGQTAKGLAKSFFTEMGAGGWGIVDQVLSVGSRIARNKEDKTLDKGIELLEKTGIKNKFLTKIKEEDYADVLEEFRTKIKDRVAQNTQESRESNPVMDTFAGKTTGVIGGMVPQVTAALAGAPGLILSISEAAMNAEQSYDENLARGLSHEQAMTRAIPQFGADLAVTYITNKFGLMSKLGGKKSLFNFGKNKAGRITSGIAEYLKDSGLEVGQEIIQNGLQNLATDKPFTQGMGETAKLTIIPALLFGAGGAAVNLKDPIAVKQKTAETIDTINEKLANDEPLTEEETLAYAVTDGVNPFDETATEEMTPEGIQEIASQFAPQEQEADIFEEETTPIINAETKTLRDPEEGMVFSHGTTKQNKESLLKHGIDTTKNTKGRAEQPAAFYIADESESGGYGDAKVGVRVKPGEKVKTLSISSPEWAETVGKSKNAQETATALEELRNRGYDAINNGDEIEVINPKKFEVFDTEVIKPKKAPVKKPTPKKVEPKPVEKKSEPKTKTRGLAKGVEAKAVEKKLTEGFGGLPEYEEVNMKDQSDKAKQLVESDPDRAIRIAMGQEKAPDGILPEAVFIAVENMAIANGDVSLLQRLATQSELVSEATEMGQRIRTLAERSPDSPLGAIQAVVKARQKRYERKNKGKTLSQEKRKVVSEIKEKAKAKKIEKEDWSSFVNSLEC